MEADFRDMPASTLDYEEFSALPTFHELAKHADETLSDRVRDADYPLVGLAAFHILARRTPSLADTLAVARYLHSNRPASTLELPIALHIQRRSDIESLREAVARQMRTEVNRASLRLLLARLLDAATLLILLECGKAGEFPSAQEACLLEVIVAHSQMDTSAKDAARQRLEVVQEQGGYARLAYLRATGRSLTDDDIIRAVEDPSLEDDELMVFLAPFAERTQVLLERSEVKAAAARLERLRNLR